MNDVERIAEILREQEPDEVMRARVLVEMSPELDALAERFAAPRRVRWWIPVMGFAAAAACVALIWSQLREPSRDTTATADRDVLRPYVVAGTTSAETANTLLAGRFSTLDVAAGQVVRATIDDMRLGLVGPARITVRRATAKQIDVELASGRLLVASENARRTLHVRSGTGEVVAQNAQFAVQRTEQSAVVYVERGDLVVDGHAVARGTWSGPDASRSQALVEALREHATGRVQEQGPAWMRLPPGDIVHVPENTKTASLPPTPDPKTTSLSTPAPAPMPASMPEPGTVPAPIAPRPIAPQSAPRVPTASTPQPQRAPAVTTSTLPIAPLPLAPRVPTAPTPQPQRAPAVATSTQPTTPPTNAPRVTTSTQPIAPPPLAPRVPAAATQSQPQRAPAVATSQPTPPPTSAPRVTTSTQPIAPPSAPRAPSVTTSTIAPPSAPRVTTTPADGPAAMYARAESALAARDRRRAEKLLQELITTFPGSSQASTAHFDLATLARARGDLTAARAELGRLLAGSPPAALREPASYLDCRLQADAGAATDAAACFHAFRDAFPRSAHDAEVLAWIVGHVLTVDGCSPARALAEDYLHRYPKGLFAKRAKEITACAP